MWVPAVDFSVPSSMYLMVLKTGRRRLISKEKALNLF